jgi:hypothetical protein
MRVTNVCALWCGALLFACGGGGGSGDPPTDDDAGAGTGGSVSPRPDASGSGGGQTGGTPTPDAAPPVGGTPTPDAAPPVGGTPTPDAAPPVGGTPDADAARPDANLPMGGVPMGGAEPPPDDVPAFCAEVCPELVACGIPADVEAPAEVVEACRQGCLTESTPAQRACVRRLPAADCEGRSACFAADAPPPDPAVLAACERACDAAVACGTPEGVEPPAEILAACQSGCLAESDAAQRQCVSDAAGDCEAIDACFAAGGPEPDAARVAACTASCATVVACQGAEVPAEVEATCVSGCVDTATPEQLDCVGAAAGCEGIEACFAVAAPPVDPGVRTACERACDAVLACQGAGPEPAPPVPDDLRATCVAGCLDTSTPEQRACVAGAGPDCDRLNACFAGGGAPAPDPVVAAECDRACGVLLACSGAAGEGVDVPAEVAASCVEGCVSTSTPEQRDCVSANDVDCAAAQACFEEAGAMP